MPGRFEDAAVVHRLLLQPPEPIASHFFVTYGSALQMLKARPLDDCRELVPTRATHARRPQARVQCIQWTVHH